MGKKRASRIITFAGIGVIAALIIFMVSLQVEAMKNSEFRKSIDNLALDTISLTQEYQAEEGKWVHKQHDNSTMISIIDTYKPKYQALIDRAQALETPDRYVSARDSLIKSVQSEMDSNDHFRIYLVSGNQSEYDMSSELLTQSLAYSADYDAAMKAAG
jgi:hypothetical protein